MSNRKALFIDLDGTLYDNHQQQIPESTLYGLKNLKPEVDLFLATGRSFFTLQAIESILPIFSGLVLLNGQHVIYKNSIIYQNHINPALLKRIVNRSKERQVAIGLVSLEKAYVYPYFEDVRQFFSKRAGDNIIDCTEAEFDFNLPIAMIWVFDNLEKINWLEKEIPELTFLRWGKYGCDVVSLGDSKKTGLLKIMAEGKYLFENTYAIGNGDNDVEMFKTVKHSCAMLNSSPLALKSASFITSDIKDEGLYKALKAFDLLNH